MSIMSWIFVLNIASASINEIAIMTFLLKVSSKKERLSRRTARGRSSNGKRTQWRTSAHVLPRLFSICSPSCIDFTWLPTCSRHVWLPFRTHLAIVAGYSNVNTHGCIWTYLKEVYGEMHRSEETGLSHSGPSFGRRNCFFLNKIWQERIREMNCFQRIRKLFYSNNKFIKKYTALENW